MHARTRTARTLIGTALALVVCTVGVCAPPPGAADEEPIQRTVYGKTAPDERSGPGALLQQVVIAPGAKLPEHFHEGTQLATIRAGVLTYNVVSGEAVVTRAGGRTQTVVGPGVVIVAKGDALGRERFARALRLQRGSGRS